MAGDPVRNQAWLCIAGVDEAGRGPLAGPVVAAAVILNPAVPINGLADSKAISAARREKLAVEIRQKALAWAVARAEVEEIDRINILQASMLAMSRSIQALSVRPQKILVDGNCCPETGIPAEAVVRGDKLVPAISAASILAKVSRDQEMVALDALFPGYGFATHKGYPTKIHIAALMKLGACPIHRQSFSPVRKVLDGNDI